MKILLGIGLLVGAAYAGSVWQKNKDEKACPALKQQTQTKTETIITDATKKASDSANAVGSAAKSA